MPRTEIDRALAACRGALLAVGAFSCCVNLLALASPLYMLQIYDRVLSSRSEDTLLMLTGITIAALGVLSLLDAIRRAILQRVAVWLGDRLQGPVLEAALRCALLGDGAAASQAFRDVGLVQGLISGPAVTPLMDAPWAPIFLGALFLFHPLLGATGLAGAVLLVALALLNEAATRAPLARAGQASRRTLYFLDAALRNADVIHALGMLGGVAQRVRADEEEAKAAQRTAAARGSTILAVSKFSRLALQSLVMGAGAWLAIRNEASAGAVFAGSFLLSRSLAPLENAIGTWKSLAAARAARQRLAALLATRSPAVPGMALPRPDGALVLEQAVYVPPGTGAPTLRGVSLALAPGEALGVVGPSGAGKSTLARLVAGTWTPSAGHVRLDGADIAVWHAAGGSRHLGYLPQDVELFAGTVRDNIARLADAAPDEIVAAATLAGAHEFVMRLPRGYDTEIGEAGLKLSGGQRQRLALARAVFGRPRLVVLDEPDANLDQEGEASLAETLARLKETGATVVVISHRPSLLRAVDKILLLRGGTADAFGPRDEVVGKVRAAALARDRGAGRVRPLVGTGSADGLASPPAA